MKNFDDFIDTIDQKAFSELENTLNDVATEKNIRV